MEKKFTRILSCPFGERRKVQVTNFAFEDFIFVVGSAANSVGTTLEFAAFGSGLVYYLFKHSSNENKGSDP